MDTKTKKLQLYKYLGAMLMSKGQDFLKLAFNVKITKILTRLELLNILKENKLNSWLADEKYYLTDIQTWKDIIKYNWTSKRKYLVDRRDCDNFSGKFHSMMAWIYGLNTAGDAKQIEIKDVNTGKHKFWHRANIIVATDNGKVKLYAYEPQTDEIAEFKNPINLRSNWEYDFSISIVEFN